MVDISAFFQEFSKILTVMFGFNPDQSLSLVYYLIVIFTISWLSLAGYLLSKKPRLLEKWKYPTISSLSIIFLISISSYLVAYLIVLAITMFSAFENKTFIQIPFIIIALFMIGYIVIYLSKIKIPKKVKDTETIPRELTQFVPKSFEIAFFLFFINLELYFIHDALATGVFPTLTKVPVVRKWIVVVMFFLMIIMFFFTLFKTNETKKFTDGLTKKARAHKCAASIIMIVFVLLLFVMIVVVDKLFPITP